MEIAEEAEEDQRIKRQSTVHEERPVTAKEPTKQIGLDDDILPSAVNIGKEIIRTLSTPTLENNNNNNPPTSPTTSRRLSSQSVRPHMYTLNSYGTSNKPKVKLGPRPSLDHKALSDSPYRPVSVLPAGLRIFRRGSKKQKSRPQSTYQSAGISLSISDDTSSPQMKEPMRPHTSSGHPTPDSGASVKFVDPQPPLPATLTPSPLIRSKSIITPEKARLMKALQLRKKQMGSPASESQKLEMEPQPSTSVAHRDDLVQHENKTNGGSNATEVDSGTTTAYATNDLCSELTKTDSSPTSPIGTEHAVSTKASSLSESTDETVQESTSQKIKSLPEEVTGPAETEIDDNDTDIYSLSDVDEAQEDEPKEKVGREALEEAEAQSERVQEDGVETVQVIDHVIQPQSTYILPQTTYDNTVVNNASDQQNVPNAQVVMRLNDDVLVGDNSFITNSSMVVDVSEFPEGSQDVFAADDSLDNSMIANDSMIAEASDLSETIRDALSVPPPAKEALDVQSSEEEVSVPNLEVQQLAVLTSPNEYSTSQDHVSITVHSDKSLHVETPASSMAGPIVQSELETQSEESPKANSPRDLKIPRSKFSIPDLRVASGDQIGSQAENLPPMPTGLVQNGLIQEKKLSQTHMRKPSGNRNEISAANSENDNELLDDDDLMDELQSATVQEAKPVSVVSREKQPNNGSDRLSRLFSNPILKEDRRNQESPPSDSVQRGRPATVATRSVSAGDVYLDKIKLQQAATIAKKVSVGTGISQRIKALQQFSSSPPLPGPAPGSSSPSTSFFDVGKSNVRSTKPPSIAERANSLTKNSPSFPRSPSFSPESSPDAARLRDRGSSIKSRKEAFNIAGPSPRTRPSSSSQQAESISVTAHIIRDTNQPFAPMADAHTNPSEYAPLDLVASPLTIDHQVGGPSLKSQTIQERRSSKEIKHDRRSSMTFVKDLLSSPRRSSFSSIGRRSITIEPSEPSPAPKTPAVSRPASIRSQRSSRGTLSPSASTTMLSPTSPSNKPPLSGGNLKSEGRGKNIMRRMSASFDRSRKALGNAISPTLREEAEPSQHLSVSGTDSSRTSTSQPSTVSTEIGDVNVQFPDTLLWKRRHVLLDSQGFLVLSASATQGNSSAKAAVVGSKRYHMSEIKMPFLPDIEMQELPNSVSLEFVAGGGGLQFACEDRAAQSHVLHCKFFSPFIVVVVGASFPIR